jgi:hypothetical protein
MPKMKTRRLENGVSMDILQGGRGYGDVAEAMAANNMDPGALRPCVEVRNGQRPRKYVVLYDGLKVCTNKKDERYGQLVPTYKKHYLSTNAPASLTRDSWIQIDQAVLGAAMPRLGFVNRLRSRNLTYNLPNAMGKTVFETRKIGRITPATVSMDPVRRGDSDKFDLDYDRIPLPIIHKDADFTFREIAISRTGGFAFDTTYLEQAGEEVAIEIERLAIGTSAFNGYSFGGNALWGLLNFPDRMTKTDMTVPDGTNGAVVVAEIIEMREAARLNNQYGPWTLLVSPAWEAWLDSDYRPGTGDDRTLRERILAIKRINKIESMDYIDDGAYHMLLVNEKTTVIRLIIGFDIQTIQWSTQGGQLNHYKVMAMILPQLRADIDGRTGIVHGTTT